MRNIKLSKNITKQFRILPEGTCKSNQEEVIRSFPLKIHKFNNRPRPENIGNIAIFPMFSEFGCETVGVLYCLPSLLQDRYLGKYTIVVGWGGRSYLYKHLVDEFWETAPEHQSLREYCRAFHHISTNLKSLEKELEKYGKVVPIHKLGNIAVSQLFTDVKKYKKTAVWLPSPSQVKLDSIQKYIKPNSVGIIARNRKCYGRNLPPDFYIKLIHLVRNMGYNPVWIGEKSTTLPCPVDDITDFSVSEEANDLECTFALTSCLDFTIQFWTASTRLAGMVGTPYLLFESPDQIYGAKGQEGFRAELCTKGNKKIVLSHYRSSLENQDNLLSIVEESIREIQQNDFSIKIGLVEDYDLISRDIKNNKRRIGF